MGCQRPGCPRGRWPLVGAFPVDNTVTVLLILIPPRAYPNQVMPLVIPLCYFFLLPRPASFSPSALPASYEDEIVGAQPTTPYTALPTDEDAELTAEDLEPKAPMALNLSEKWRLVRPMLPKYMLPLCEWPTR